MAVGERSRHPALRSVTPPDPRMAFYDTYPGGWQEVFPVGGAPSGGPGLPFGSHGMHGEVWHRPWDWEVIDDGAARVAVRLSIRTETLPYRLVRDVVLESGSATVTFEERASNESQVDLPLMWGHHITFGRPFLGPGAVIEMPDGVEVITGDIARSHPVRRLAPNRISPWTETVGSDGATVDLSRLPAVGSPGDMVYLRGFAEGLYRVRGATSLGLEVRWDAAVMPFVWFWQEFGTSKDYPWFGRHYNIGLEPFTSMPREGLVAAVENGSVQSLPAGANRAFTLQASVIEPT